MQPRAEALFLYDASSVNVSKSLRGAVSAARAGRRSAEATHQACTEPSVLDADSTTSSSGSAEAIANLLQQAAHAAQQLWSVGKWRRRTCAA